MGLDINNKKFSIYAYSKLITYLSTLKPEKLTNSKNQ